MAKKRDEKFYLVDHANKHADRERTNPNRRKLRFLRAWDCVPENAAVVVRGARKATEEQE